MLVNFPFLICLEGETEMLDIKNILPNNYIIISVPLKMLIRCECVCVRILIATSFIIETTSSFTKKNRKADIIFLFYSHLPFLISEKNFYRIITRIIRNLVLLPYNLDNGALAEVKNIIHVRMNTYEVAIC